MKLLSFMFIQAVFLCAVIFGGGCSHQHAEIESASKERSLEDRIILRLALKDEQLIAHTMMYPTGLDVTVEIKQSYFYWMPKLPVALDITDPEGRQVPYLPVTFVSYIEPASNERFMELIPGLKVSVSIDAGQKEGVFFNGFRLEEGQAYEMRLRSWAVLRWTGEEELIKTEVVSQPLKVRVRDGRLVPVK